MISCPNCNAQLADEAVFCEHCGKQLQTSNVCPFCGKPLNPGAKFCSNCGKSIGSENAPKKNYVWWIVGAVVALLLIGGGVAFYLINKQKADEARLQQEQELRELAMKDSLEEVQYQQELLQQQEAEALQARTDEIRAFITACYSYHGQYMDKIKRYYSTSLLNAVNSWSAPEGLDGPMPLLFEKKWDEGCGSWCEIRNYKPTITEISTPDENSATVTATVAFDVHSAYEDQEYLESASHSDVFKLVQEGGEWRIDDLIRDGSSMKQKYSMGSEDRGKEIC